jgi:anti-anti-sigma factor
MNLKLKMKKHNDIPILVLSGNAVGQDVCKVAEKIESLIKSGTKTIAIDCENLDSIDSHGLGMFVFSWKLMEAQKRKLVFLNPSEFIKNLFEGANLDRVFTIIASIEEL